ncbi:MAG: ATP-binding protein, partial [Planctomycetota bacterium]
MTHRDQPDPLTRAVAAFIDARALLRPGEAVLVAVSGGADSVALLAVLRELAAESGRAYQLTAAHLNHRLRDA